MNALSCAPAPSQPSPPAGDCLALFGSPRIRYAGSDREEGLEWRRAVALLAYLACRPNWHSRDAVAHAFRPDANANSARAYLRSLVHRTRNVLPRLSSFEIADDRIRWAGASDVRAFELAVKEADWERAIGLQQAPLLSGVGSTGLSLLDDWFDEERLRLRQQFRAALIASIGASQKAGRDCADLMLRLAEDDPTDENGVQFLLGQARTSRERHAAATAFHSLQRRLATDLGQKPMATTLQLFGALQAHDAAPAPAGPVRPSCRPRPQPATPCPLGRDAVLGELLRLVRQDGVRLLTIHGFGGVGKSVLARALFERLEAGADMPCAWVDLLASESLHAMLQAIALQLEVSAPGPSIEDHLALSLAGRRMVIFLDNFEQLIPHAQALERLLAAAPAIHLVVTSREMLKLPQEHALSLAGLDHRGTDSPAAQLFTLHAARAGCRPGPRDTQAVADIVAFLEGLPLAIELAAKWVPLFPPAAILCQLRNDPGFLDGLPDAQALSTRTMGSVFSAAWKRLEPAEQAAIGGLALAMAPMDFETARALAAADAGVLLRLINKSLLQRSSNGLFTVHPLLRQFAKAQARPDALAQARERHAGYFLSMVAADPPLRLGCHMPARLDALRPHIEDICKAWCLAVDTGRTDLIGAALPNLSVLLLLEARHEEAARLCAYAGDVAVPQLAEHMAGLRALAALNLGRMDEAESVAQRALLGAPTRPGRAWVELALTRLCWFRSDYGAALAHAQRALIAVPAEDPWLQIVVTQEMAQCRYALGQLEQARCELAACLRLALQHHALHSQGRSLCVSGVICTASERPQEAIRLLEAGMRIFREIGDPFQIAFAQRCMSYAFFRMRDGQRQSEAARAALDGFRSAGYYHEMGESLFAVGLASHASGKAGEAWDAYRDALGRCLAGNNLSGALRCIVQAGILAVEDGKSWGIAAACFALAHPALRQPDAHVFMEQLMATGIAASALEEGRRQAAGWTLEHVSGLLFGNRAVGPASTSRARTPLAARTAAARSGRWPARTARSPQPLALSLPSIGEAGPA